MKSSKNTAERCKWGGNFDCWVLVKNKERSVVHKFIPPKSMKARHYHNYAQQFFFILSGTATLGGIINI